jgi:hypothetical protein
VTGMSRRWVLCRLRQLAAEGLCHPDRPRLLARREMTIRNRERKVQVHALTCVCTYSGVITAGTCTKPVSRAVTNRYHRAPRLAANRGESSCVIISRR